METVYRRTNNIMAKIKRVNNYAQNTTQTSLKLSNSNQNNASEWGNISARGLMFL
jgi:ABC-type enterochelin transport system substrate-binding protein